MRINNMRCVHSTVVVVLTFAVLVVGRSSLRGSDRLDPPDPEEHLPPSDSILGVYWDAAVATNGVPCAIFGRNILMKNGSAVEAAIASLFCEGVACPHSMGLGGGFLMTIYEKATGKVTTLNAREMAPGAAYKDMFDGDADAAQYGGKAAAIPGEIKGYWEAFNRFKSGHVTWAELIEPTINLCREGVVVSASLARALKNKESVILNSPTLSEIMIDPATNETWKQGDLLKRLKLAETLEVLAEEGGDAFYVGSLVEGFVNDMEELDGIITLEDMANYKVEWAEPITATFKDGMTMYTMPPPGSGVLLAFILNVLDGFLPANDQVTTYQRVVETFKYAYGKRTELGDPNFNDLTELVGNLTSLEYAAAIRAAITDDRTFQDPEHYGAVVVQPDDHGTAQVCVLAPNGDAVSVTSTINLFFGAKIRSRSTGIILNDIMDDFAAPNITNGFGVPPSPANFIEPGKRPLSSMGPTIFVDTNGDVRLVVGSAGGTMITTATALVAMHNLWGAMDLKEALDESRFHHQLFPMTMQYEYGMTVSNVEGLSSIGHNVSRYMSESSVTAISRENGRIFASYDFRRSGITAGF